MRTTSRPSDGVRGERDVERGYGKVDDGGRLFTKVAERETVIIELPDQDAAVGGDGNVVGPSEALVAVARRERRRLSGRRLDQCDLLRPVTSSGCGDEGLPVGCEAGHAGIDLIGRERRGDFASP